MKRCVQKYIWIVGAAFLALPLVVGAASVSFSPSTGTYEVGDRFSVRVLVSSTDQVMNAVSSDISFSPNRLQLISILQSGSIIDFWAQAPSFSNQSGKASFDGVVLSGYQGGGGELVTLVFRAAGIGSTTLEIPVGTVLAHDGLGTIIPSTFGKASFTIVEAGIAPPVLVPLRAPRISSSTHPDENQWYSSNDPVFTWELTADVIDVDAVISRDETPPVYTSSTDGIGLIARLAPSDVQEGTHYLHVTFKTDDEWEETTTFQFNVDTEAPDRLTIEEVYRSQPDDRRAEFAISGSDKTSGISHYRITIDGLHTEDWIDEGSGRYITPSLWYGGHTISVEAVDQAGNTRMESLDFSISYPLAPILIVLGILIILLLAALIWLLYSRRTFMKKGFEELDDNEKALLHRLQTDLMGMDRKIHADLELIKKRLQKQDKAKK